MTIFDRARALLAASLQDAERLAHEFREHLTVEFFEVTKEITGLSQQALVELRDLAHHGRGITGAQQAASAIVALQAAQPQEQPAPVTDTSAKGTNGRKPKAKKIPDAGKSAETD